MGDSTCAKNKTSPKPVTGPARRLVFGFAAIAASQTLKLDVGTGAYCERSMLWVGLIALLEHCFVRCPHPCRPRRC